MTFGSGDRIFLAPTPGQVQADEANLLPPWPVPSPQTNWPAPLLQPPPKWPPVSPEIADISEWKQSKAPMPITMSLLGAIALLSAAVAFYLAWRSAPGDRWFRVGCAIGLVAGAVATLVLGARDRRRHQQLPAEYRGVAREARLTVETRPDPSRGTLKMSAGAFVLLALLWAPYAVFPIGDGSTGLRYLNAVIAFGYLLVAAWRYHEIKYLKHLDKTAPIGSPAGWLRDEHGYSRWWDGYKWTLAFAPGEAERSRSGPPAMTASPTG